MLEVGQSINDIPLDQRHRYMWMVPDELKDHPMYKEKDWGARMIIREDKERKQKEEDDKNKKEQDKDDSIQLLLTQVSELTKQVNELTKQMKKDSK